MDHVIIPCPLSHRWQQHEKNPQEKVTLNSQPERPQLPPAPPPGHRCRLTSRPAVQQSPSFFLPSLPQFLSLNKEIIYQKPSFPLPPQKGESARQKPPQTSPEWPGARGGAEVRRGRFWAYLWRLSRLGGGGFDLMRESLPAFRFSLPATPAIASCD